MLQYVCEKCNSRIYANSGVERGHSLDCPRYIGCTPEVETEQEKPLIRTFSTGATRDENSNKLDVEGFVSPLVTYRFSQYMHEKRKMADGTMRDSDNWQKGLPVEECLKSLCRHVLYLQLLFDGVENIKDDKGNYVNMQDELCAIRFNADAILFELLQSEMPTRRPTDER